MMQPSTPSLFSFSAALSDRAKGRLKYYLVLAAAYAAMSVVLPCVAAESSTDDDSIRHSIQRYLDAETTISPGAVAIQFEDGIAMLAGTVSNLLQHDQAERIAESIQRVRADNIVAQIEGVLTLENRIEVSTETGPDPVDDVDITAAIMDELFWSPYVDSDTITVRVKAGRAELKGRVANRFIARIDVANAFEGGARTVRTILDLESGGTLVEHFLQKPETAGPGIALGLWR